MHYDTLVLGASTNPERYAFKAINALRRAERSVLAVGLRPGRVADVDIVKEIPADAVVETVTMYVGAANQGPWIDRLIALAPQRIIFNPGAENPVLAEAARKAGIAVEEACTLVLLSTGQYAL